MLQSLHHFGGIGTYTRHIVKHLLALDKENEYVFFYPSFKQGRKFFGLYKNYENCTEVLSSSLIPIMHYWDQISVPFLAKKYGIDVLFNPYESIPVRGNFRKIFVLHNSERFIMPEVFWYSERYTGRLRMQALMRAADCIISVSHKVAEDLMQMTGLPQSKFRVVHNAPGEEFQPIKDTATHALVREKYRLPHDFVLFVGRIYPQKNFSGLLEAFHLIAHKVPHQLVVAGGTHPKFKLDSDLIQKLNLKDRIQFVGWVGHEDLPALYNLATCLVIPSFHESCSVALLEALSCGCPVIASKTGGNPEVVGDAALLVDPANPVEISDTILKVLADADLRQRLAQAGLVRAQEFSWEKSAAKTLKVFSEFSGRVSRSG
jgi:glycosyltransferase involved in cell wall biosynthesis